MRLLSFVFVMALGCTSAQEDKADDTGTSVDADADGWTVEDGDCDDENPAVNPDATESCNEIDDNCDGQTDENAGETYYADADGDTFGDEAAPMSACLAPDGYVSNADDCDDASADAFPDAPELCNGADDDCDGEVDEDPTDPTDYYVDADEDGYGDDADAVSGCEAPEGYVAEAGDCDDADAAFHPGADEADCADPNDYNCDGSVGYSDEDGDGWAACEECDDGDAGVSPEAVETCNGVDDNCDGTVDEADAFDTGTWYLDLDADGYGDLAVSVEACDQPAGYVAEAGDCDDAAVDVHPGADEVCDGVDNDCDGTADNDDSLDASTWYADADEDGYGAPGSSLTACEAPASYVADATDCDDTRGDDNPGADELCDSRDNNCDGTVDEDSAVDASSWYYDSDEDGYGDDAIATVTCDEPAGYVLLPGDCDDADAGYNPGAAESCDDPNDYNCDGSTTYADADGDGWAACEDCDDSEAAVNPDAVESCNLIDDDCDGTVDEDDAIDASAWYADGDGDGYGDAIVSLTACLAPAGFLADATDCDDEDGAVRPGATEVCDSIDNNCDGTVDEDSAADALTWYADADADTYGDSASTYAACSVPSGYVADATDCDDTRTSDNPGATEVCDSRDNNCDGTVDEDSAADALTWYADADADTYGDPSSTYAACVVPSGYVADATDCDDTNSAYNPAATETCDGSDNNCDGTVDEDSAADALTWYLDADSDSYGDPAFTYAACVVPSGYAADGTDCEDADSGINPGAYEVPQDGIDQDCDGEDGPYLVTDLVAGDLVVTEIMQNPLAVTDAVGEWFELYNASGGTIDLDGLYVYDLGSDHFTVSGELLLDAGGYAVFALNGDSGVNGGVTVDYDYASFSLANADDEVYLAESSAKTTIIDGVAYDGGPDFPDPNGASMNLDPSLLDATSNDDGANWCEASSSFGSGDLGTPGAENDSCTEL